MRFQETKSRDFKAKCLPCSQASLLALCTSPSSLQYPHEVPPATHRHPL